MRHSAIAKTISALILALLIFSCAATALAAPAVNEEKTSALCNACMLVDAGTGTVIYASENASVQIAPASTTKILTAIVVIENCNLGDMITAGDELDGVIGSKMGLVKGDTLSVKDLLYGMMLPSGNDAATVLAKHAGGEGGMEAFVQMMNDKAKALGMDNSHFMNPHGLDNEEHYVTAEDMAKVTLYALDNPTFAEIVSTKTYTVPETEKSSERILINSNKLLCKADKDNADYTYAYTTGVKTGATKTAGSCIIASAEKDGTSLIALVFGTPSEKAEDKWGVARYLFEYGFENYTSMELSGLAPGYTATATVNNAVQADGSKGITRISCYGDVPEGTVVTVDKSDMDSSEITVEFTPKNGGLEAPIFQGDVIGTISYKLGGKMLYECDAIAAESALETLGADNPNSPVTSIDPIDLSHSGTKDLTADQISKTLWWVLGPLLAIAVLLIVLMVIKARGGFARGASLIGKPTYVNTTKNTIAEEKRASRSARSARTKRRLERPVKRSGTSSRRRRRR